MKIPNDKQKRRSRIHLAAKMRKAGPHDKKIKRLVEEPVMCETCRDRTYVATDNFHEFKPCPDCWGEDG